MSRFIHLHCHTEYSLLDGAIRVRDLCAKAKEYDMDAVAITDHGNMFGAAYLYKQAKAEGIKPIIGCEIYVAHTDYQDKTSEFARTWYHLVLLAQNMEGYKNLTKLVSLGCTKGLYYKPRVDKALLRAYNAGIVALSGCLAGELPRILLAENSTTASLEKNRQKKSVEEYGDRAAISGGMERAIQTAREYAAIFPDRFYLELQSNGLEEQRQANALLIELSKKTGLPLVATNDCHYLNRDDAEAHDILLCIQTQKTLNDANRFRFETRELYYKSPDEMEAAFKDCPEALENSVRIAKSCDLTMKFREYHFPLYTPPPNASPLPDVTEEYEDPTDIPAGEEGLPAEEQHSNKQLRFEFRRLCREGLERRLDHLIYSADRKVYNDRLEMELSVICRMGFAPYFLIVQDFINWAKNNGIPVGPGRGSAAGSIVAWALKITNLDPIHHHLLFERFLNVERISMPDIDIDFCEQRRGEVIGYVSSRYGHDSVAQIITFGKMKAKAAIRDVGRAMGMSFQETDRIAKLIPNDLKMTIQKALDTEPDLKKLYDSDEGIKKLIDISLRLEGLNRHASTHAAGVVISDRPMTEYLPVYHVKKGEKEDFDIDVTQFDMKMVEEVGLIKFDFLGLRTMTLIHKTLENIELQGHPAPDLDNLPLDDQAVYEMYSRGDTDGIFQVESSGMRKYLTMLRPTTFEDLVAMLALYRPGPLGSGMVDEFIRRKHGEVEVTYPLSSLETCLKDTYGIIVYQEQVMQIAQIVAGYTLGGADILRRAMGKKNPQEMAKQREIFVKGALTKNVDESKANEIFDLMEKFAEYGFNKSHSAAYALVSYYTAYLKYHYPKEFMAALLTSEMANQDKLFKYVMACRSMGIKVQPPSLHLSKYGFSVHGEKIVFGLGGIKNVGEEAIQEVLNAREKDGLFSSLLDLCQRVPLKRISKRVIESFIKAGACDDLGCSRAALLAGLDGVVARAQKKIKEKESNQISMFSMVNMGAQERPGLGFDCPEQDTPELEPSQMLAFEKDVLGFFFSGHPLEPFQEKLQAFKLPTLDECRQLKACNVRIPVLVNTVRTHLTKREEKMAFLQVDDWTTSAECVVFPRTYDKIRSFLTEDALIMLDAKLEFEEVNAEPEDELEEPARQMKLIVQHAAPIQEFLTAHPLIPLQNEMRRLGLDTLEECFTMAHGQTRKVGFIIQNIKKHITQKKAKAMAFLQIEDLTLSTEAALYPAEFEKVRHLLRENEIFVGSVQIESNEPSLSKSPSDASPTAGAQTPDASSGENDSRQERTSLRILDLLPFREATDVCERPIVITFSLRDFLTFDSAALKKLITAQGGNIPLILQIEGDTVGYRMRLGDNYKVGYDNEFVARYKGKKQETDGAR